jgi:Rhodopirellula transposase DDE domain
MATEDEIARRFKLMSPHLDERSRRLWAGAEAHAIGRGGREAVARATGLSRTTILHGMKEVLERDAPEDLVEVRRKGAGSKPIDVQQPGIFEALDALVEPVARGDPESPLRWTCKSTRKLSAELLAQGFRVSQHKIAEMLRSMGYSLQATRKTIEGEVHPDRNAQFEHINNAVKAFQSEGQPVVSVDTKKKELVGAFQNRGQEWQPKGIPDVTNTHDFPDMADGKAIPYGVYDVARNQAWVSVGLDHDTPSFAVNSVRSWWKTMGRELYAGATRLLITADAGGSNSYRSRLWKAELQRLATEIGLSISVVHFPPGTSKWNKIEHRLFSHISMNWRGRPLEDYETIVELIGSTTTRTGLRVKARLDRRKYKTGVDVPDEVMNALHLRRAPFHGEWNYTLDPQAIA